MASPAQAEAAAALAALNALLGPNVALCVRDDASAPGSPSHDPHKCCDDCALRQCAGHSAILPPGHAAAVLVARCAKPPSVSADAGLAGARMIASAQPRGPPISA